MQTGGLANDDFVIFDCGKRGRRNTSSEFFWGGGDGGWKYWTFCCVFADERKWLSALT